MTETKLTQIKSAIKDGKLVQSAGGITTTVTQSDKIGFDWKNFFVNDIPVSICKMKDGDYLRVGNCIYRFLAGGNVAQYACVAVEPAGTASPVTHALARAATASRGAERDPHRPLRLGCKQRPLLRVNTLAAEGVGLDRLRDLAARRVFYLASDTTGVLRPRPACWPCSAAARSLWSSRRRSLD